MFESTSAKADLFAAVTRDLKTKDGPVRLENIALRALGVDWRALDNADRRIIAGAVARCGWKSAAWPLWYRDGSVAFTTATAG